MKLLLSLMVGLLVLGLNVAVEAAEKPKLQKARCATATAMTAAGVLVVCSGSGERITGVSITCSGTACAGGVYDSVDGTTSVTNADVEFELGAAASTTAYIDLSDTPIRTTNGVALLLDSNVLGMVIHTQAP